MNKTIKIIIVVIAALLIVWAIIAATNKPSDQENKAEGIIKIGVVGPFSGDVAFYGEQLQSILDYELVKINEKYKDQNVSFELVYEDGKCTGNDAVSAFQKLTDIDGVKFILGGLCSSESLAIAPLAESKKILAFGLASSPEVDGAGAYTYSMGFKDDTTAKTLAKEMSKYKRVAIISEQNDYNEAIQNVWLEEMKKYPDIAVVANETFVKGGIDFRNVLEKVRKTNPEAILLNPNAGATGKVLIKQLAEIKDWSGYKLFGNLAYLNEDVIATAPQILEGMIIADAKKITDPKFIELQKTIEESKGKVSDMGTYYVAATVDLIHIYTDLIVKYGADPTVVRDALISDTFNGYTSNNIKFSNSSFPSIEGGVYKIKNGKPEYQE